MIELRPTELHNVAPWIKDFQRRAKSTEPLPQMGRLLGIFRGEELIGYFILVCYDDAGVVEINQGYLRPDSRHKNLSKISMELLERLVKENGYKQIVLGTNRAVGSYIHFMKSMGYSIQRAIFAKEVK